MKKAEPIAVACSDLHLTLMPPACRADKDWMEVQAGYLRQLKGIAGELPVLCAGDIFDKWNASPELINFALEHLPDRMIAIPGQHDLPNHRREEMHRSGYGVLCQAGKIRDISDHPKSFTTYNAFDDVNYSTIVYGCPWGADVPTINLPLHRQKVLKILLIHRYVWTTRENFFGPGAPMSAQLSHMAKSFRGYDAVFFGDNHKGFKASIALLKKGVSVLNCGTFIRRKSDELDYKPSVGVLYSDGSVKQQYLDTSKDRFHKDAKKREADVIDMKAFLTNLEKLGEQALDFAEAVKHQLPEAPKAVRDIILKSLE